MSNTRTGYAQGIMALIKTWLAGASAFVMACAGANRPTLSPTAATPPSANEARPSQRAAEPPELAPAAATVIAQPQVRDTSPVSESDVSRGAASIFGDSVAAPPTPDEPSWDIDVHSYESRSRVEHYVQLFSGSAKERIQARLEEGTRYEPMIRAKMRDGGLPEDMYYLALVESGFDPNAYSRAAAVGMWQFMTSTGRDMGLRVDWWVDERRDPVKSTVAAVRFIKGLKEQFGSLYLAAAAYNGGPGRVARGLSRYADDLEGTSGDDLFFALAEKNYLRNETREYVPQLIAAALIAKEPDRYGMSIVARPPFEFDSVRVGPGTPMPAIARAVGSSVADLTELNPQILRGVTPPKDSLFVRVPLGTAESFDSSFASLPDEAKVGLKSVTSKKGESIATIARRAGITSKQLSMYNPKLKKLKSGNLVVGQKVVVPTPAVAAAAVSVPDPSIERYSRSRGSTTHVVKSGETLSGIAKRYHTTTSSLMKTNHLKKALIFPGQSLVIRR